MSIYHDDYRVAGLNAVTFVQIAGIGVLIAAAIYLRSRLPVVSFAIAWFVASHLLESTVINLELYFEHRNYLPACFLFLPLIAWLYGTTNRRIFVVAAVAITLILGGFLRYSATVWQSYPSMVEASARKAPTSARAQAQYATQLFNAGQADADADGAGGCQQVHVDATSERDEACAAGPDGRFMWPSKPMMWVRFPSPAQPT